ncbi:MAG TPA: DUF2207 domain-containing protein [Thermoanaerobaculia bacterium]|nr:DUF2207 domain-containing protein [Thermoanaerobaculia bacterium]
MALCAFLVASSLSAKSLHWKSFDVTARLDADGRLNVREQQGIVFDGDWNGGERRFNIRPGQSLRFERMFRVENGRDIPMAEGDVSQVDRWYLNATNVLRWRSRLPSDPPFHDQQITYALEYTLSGVLQRTDSGVRLHHDFAFPDRSGEIEDFSLHLDLDPAWRGIRSPVVMHREHLRPGESVFVDADLTYSGAGSPADVQSTVTTSHAMVISLLLVIAGAILIWKFYIDEKHKGRFTPLMPSVAINSSWLDRYVFSLPPEVVGYAWDEQRGAPEVGAVIARMEQEKKIQTWAKDKVLHMKLLVDWNTLPPGEKDLIQSLFLGQTETDTDRIKAHYKSTGFQPAQLLKDPINAALKNVPEWNQPAKAISTSEVLSFVAMILAGGLAFQVAKPLAGALIVVLMVIIVGILVAFSARRRVDIGPWTPMFFAGLSVLGGVVIAFLSISFALTDFAAVIVAAASAVSAAVILMLSRSREAIPKMEFRRRLAAARQYFELQLRSAKPNLKNEWYPYLVALGLGPQVDRWFTSFAAASRSIGDTASSFGSSSSSSTSSWTGGGGAFGGGGATGSWAAIAGVAGGVAAPSSSGGGGGGGGSGGGGGGGW